MVRRFLKDQSGQTATEYILILSILSFIIIKVLMFFREVFLEAIPELGKHVEADLTTGGGFGK